MQKSSCEIIAGAFSLYTPMLNLVQHDVP